MTFHRSIQNGAAPAKRASGLSRAVAALAAGLIALAACDGGNAFVQLPDDGGNGNGNGGTTARDTLRPTVTIELPRDSANVAVRDSVFVKAQVSDNHRLAQVTLQGYVLTGDSILGTRDTVQRFVPKTVDFLARGVVTRDSVLRFLNPTSDSTPARRVLIVATARDSSGNSRSASVFINIGGPRVQIVAPVAGDTFRAGTRLPVRIQAEDATDRIRAFQVRVTGATTQDVNVTFPTPRASVDTTVTIPLSTTPGAARVEANATSGSNLVSAAPPVAVTILPPAADVQAPLVTFDVRAGARMQASDTIVVPVQGTDDTNVDSVGATLRFRYRDPATGAAVDRLLTARLPGAAGSLRFPLALLNLPQADTVTLGVEVTGWAVDNSQNCGAAVTPNTPQRLACTTTSGVHLAAGTDGRLVLVLVTRGQTVGFASPGDTIADMASNGRLLFVSNMSANRVEVLPIAGSTFTGSVSVGSKPWGLAVSPNGDSLLVANSGGTNISVVAIPAGGTPVEMRRIRTSDVELFDVSYDIKTDSVTTVRVLEYSDRPQYLGQLTSGQILYSTRPTSANNAGTVRIYSPDRDTTYQFGRGSEIFTGYAERVPGKAIVVNADSAFRTTGNDLLVYPRPRTTGQATPPPTFVLGNIRRVRFVLDSLQALGRTDTRLDVGVDGSTLGLSDTTFVATSQQRNAIAFGEGVRSLGRVLYFRQEGSRLVGSSRASRDLLQNAAERVIGLGLNADGSLGVARGNQVYFFDNTLRLAGLVPSGAPTGGSAMHPLNVGYPGSDGRRLGFSSGATADGGAYIDVIDTYSFRMIRRLPVRDRITGTVIAVPVEAGDVDAGRYVIRLFALTRQGVLRVGLTAADLQ